jgi:hypothetical protein
MNRIASRRPLPDEFSADPSTATYTRGLVDGVDGDCVLDILHQQLWWLCELGSHLCTEQVDRVHKPYQWTVRQVFEHCANAERVFGYRMLRIAAGDQTPLVGFDENAYAASRFGLGNFTQLVNEIAALRQATELLLRRIVPKAWERSTEVNGNRMTTRAIAWVAAGHLRHHFTIVEKRCQLKVPRGPMM